MKNFILFFVLLLVYGSAFGAGTTQETFTVGPVNGERLTLKHTGEFSIDGTNFKKFGTGSGGSSGGINAFTDLQNAGAEDGLVGWTSSAGVFAIESLDPLDGSKSFLWTPAAQNNTLTSPILVFNKDSFKGRSCEANIEYIGGDENLSLKLLNADNEVLSSLVLNKHTTAAKESIFFTCPSNADIVADADKGNLRLVIENTGASASPVIKFDLSYAGTLQGLSETVLPDSFGLKIQGTTGSTEFEYGGIISSVTRDNVGSFTINFTGLTNTPNCSFTPAGKTSTPTFIPITGIVSFSNLKYIVQFRENSSTVNAVDPTYIMVNCHKSGVDAKQKVQVYKSIPKITENINTLTAKLNSSPSVVSTNTDWITNVTQPYLGGYEITFKTGVFNIIPVCHLTPWDDDNNNISIPKIRIISTTSMRIFGNDQLKDSYNSNYMVTCTKQGSDFKMPTVQPIIVGQTVNSYAEASKKNVRIESCRVNNGGTPVFDTASELCPSWIDSLTDVGTGQVTINIDTSIFSKEPVCTCGTRQGAEPICVLNVSSISSVSVFTYNQAFGLADTDFYISCQGAR